MSLNNDSGILLFAFMELVFVASRKRLKNLTSRMELKQLCIAEFGTGNKSDEAKFSSSWKRIM